jgi:hypothetical protein
MTLSKSQFIRGLQCHKRLWLYKHKPELRDIPDNAQESLFKTGTSVGELARNLFPGGIEIVFDENDFGGMLDKTKALIAGGVEVIYEAAFSENGVFAMADILVRNGDAWDMYEVKGSTQVKPVHIDDAAVQWFSLGNAIRLNRAYIIHIDNTYVRQGELELDKLFAIEDVTEMVLSKQAEVEVSLQQMRTMLDGNMPEIDIGGHCSDPYACEFHDHCWAHVPTPSVFDLYRMWGSKKMELYKNGIVSYDDLEESRIALNEMQSLQVRSHRTREVLVDKEAISAFLAAIRYPISFFDFETFQNAVPRFNNQLPYQQVPFQYSLHIIGEDGIMAHKEFLGDENSDPRRDVALKMLEDLPSQGSIIAYNMGFEQGQIRNLAVVFPDLSKELLALNDRFVDLIVPFRSRAYYHPDFGGSFSIKSVLPAMFPDDEELDYKKLEIQNGTMAMDTFANLHLLKEPAEREGIRTALLAYCRLDTLAMVRIWERLKELSQNSQNTTIGKE